MYPVPGYWSWVQVHMGVRVIVKSNKCICISLYNVHMCISFFLFSTFHQLHPCIIHTSFVRRKFPTFAFQISIGCLTQCSNVFHHFLFADTKIRKRAPRKQQFTTVPPQPHRVTSDVVFLHQGIVFFGTVCVVKRILNATFLCLAQFVYFSRHPPRFF